MPVELENAKRTADTENGSSLAGANRIAGRRVPGEGSVTRRVLNPADTTEVIADVREASAAQVDDACASAARAFPAWRAPPPPDRARVLFRFRELLEAHFDELARLIVRENGKLLSEARGLLRPPAPPASVCGPLDVSAQMASQTRTRSAGSPRFRRKRGHIEDRR